MTTTVIRLSAGGLAVTLASFSRRPEQRMQQFFSNTLTGYQIIPESSPAETGYKNTAGRGAAGDASGGHQQLPHRKAVTAAFFAENRFRLPWLRPCFWKQGFVQGFVSQQGIRILVPKRAASATLRLRCRRRAGRGRLVLSPDSSHAGR